MKLRLFLAAACGLLLFMLLSCGTPTVRIGYVNPTTGALSGNGEGYDWVIDQIYEHVRNHPIYIKGKPAQFEIITYDCKSDPQLCAKLATQLVKNDKVDLLLALQTIGMVIPETAVAETYGVPCISIQAPTDALSAARDRYDWTFHAFWTVDKIYECYRGLWTQAGHGVHSGSKVGFLFPADPDGYLWGELFTRRAEEDGYVVVDAGRYPMGTKDFSAVAALFKQEGVDVITGTNLPQDFINAMDAIAASGLHVDGVTMGRCCSSQSSAAALGEKAVGLMSAVWWDRSFGFVSDLTGMDTDSIARQYAADNYDAQIPQPACFAYAALELAVHAFQNAGSTNKKKLRKAISELDVTTIVGHIRYDRQSDGLRYSETVIAGGQWQFDGNELKLEVIDNSVYPELPLSKPFRAVRQ